MGEGRGGTKVDPTMRARDAASEPSATWEPHAAGSEQGFCEQQRPGRLRPASTQGERFTSSALLIRELTQLRPFGAESS